MRLTRIGAALLSVVALMVGCQGQPPHYFAPPSATASASSAPAPTSVAPSQGSPSPATQGMAAAPTVGSDYKPLYCGVRTVAANKPANVLLTIDDFPYQDGEQMVKLAEWAKQTNTMMEAFPISKEVNSYDKQHATDLVARTRALGTYVSNHTYSHPDLATISLASAKSQITRGVHSTYVRPPYGSYTKAIRQFVERDQHARVCYWTIDTRDWQKSKGAFPSAATIVGRVKAQLKQAKPGAPVVILGHYYTHYPEALPTIRDIVVKAGLHICAAPTGPTTELVPYPIC
jgi:peptidoglycan-N-acetylglucosamine deacetylase